MLWVDAYWLLAAWWRGWAQRLLALWWGIECPNQQPARAQDDGWRLPSDIRLDWWAGGRGVAPPPGAAPGTAPGTAAGQEVLAA